MEITPYRSGHPTDHLDFPIQAASFLVRTLCFRRSRCRSIPYARTSSCFGPNPDVSPASNSRRYVTADPVRWRLRTFTAISMGSAPLGSEKRDLKHPELRERRLVFRENRERTPARRDVFDHRLHQLVTDQGPQYRPHWPITRWAHTHRLPPAPWRDERQERLMIDLELAAVVRPVALERDHPPGGLELLFQPAVREDEIRHLINPKAQLRRNRRLQDNNTPIHVGADNADLGPERQLAGATVASKLSMVRSCSPTALRACSKTPPEPLPCCRSAPPTAVGSPY